MGEILGIGVTHYPPLLGQPPQYANLLRQRILASPVVPEEMKDPKSWPAGMQDEYANEEKRAYEHQERLVTAFRAVRQAIDDFGPDGIIIFGDDQYENFKEDNVPPFCVFLHEEMESRPFTYGMFGRENPWGEPAEKVFVHRGNKPLAKHLATELIERDFPVSYSFTNSHYAARGGPTMLTHAFLNSLVFLDWDRRGFEYPVIPIQVNCYGRNVIPSRGGTGHLNPAIKDEPFGNEYAPPGPTPASCFKLGQMVRQVLEERPGKYVIMGSSGWSHAFLVAKNHWLWPDLEFDREHVDDLRAGRHNEWAKITNAQIDDAGDQEFKNWICLAGAMADRQAEVIDYVPTYIFNSPKCFALFRPNGAGR